MSITTRNKMTQEDLKRALEALGKSGITVAGDLVLEKNVEYEVNNVEAGGIGIQFVGGSTAPLTAAEKDIKAALEELLEARDEKGAYVMHDLDQWYAVFRVLSHFCGYPAKAKDFEMTMKNLGADEWRVPCKYDNFRKVTLNKLPQNVGLWRQYVGTADQYSMKQLKVAVKLMDILKL